MESKRVRNTTKEDHFIKIVAGLKVVYNQIEYLAFVESPKKKKDIRLEIYIGRLSKVKDQYLLFKCETESELTQISSFFKQVFSATSNEEFELLDFNEIEKISVVSFNELDVQMDAYPEFFPLPKKEEEMDANITLPSFLTKKKESSTEPKEEQVEIVENNLQEKEQSIVEAKLPDPVQLPKPEENPVEIAQIQELPVEEISEVHSEIHENKKGKKIVIGLILFTLILMAVLVYVYLYVWNPNEKKPLKNTVKTEKLVCTREETEEGRTDKDDVTFIYEVESKKILTEEHTSSIKMEDEIAYTFIKAFANEAKKEYTDTEGAQYKFTLDDSNLTYQMYVKKTYSKLTEEEKDETYKETFDEMNEYYLNQGYTCNGITKPGLEEKPDKETTVELTSKTGSTEVDYNNWVLRMKKVTILEDKTTMQIQLEVENHATDTRSLNGLLKLYDQNETYIRNVTLNHEVAGNGKEDIILNVLASSGEPSIDSSITNTDPIVLESIRSYLIELYR